MSNCTVVAPISIPSQRNYIDQPDNGPKAINIIESTPTDFNSYEARLQTYINWPNTGILKSTLARAGFVYSGQDDVVICPFCKVEGYRWEANDNPMDDHRVWSPNCPFLGNNSEGSQAPRSNQDTCGLYGVEVVPNSVPSVDLQRLGIQKSKGPHHQDRITVDSRLETFQKWPKAIKQRPAELAEAGFFYTGVGDQTLCFYCGGGLKDWEENDDPWEQHALWFNKCSYVNLKKGQDFVAKVNSRNQPQAYSSSTSSTETKEEPVAPADTLSEKCEKISLKEGQSSEQTLCKICYRNELGVVFLPCGHIVACVDCAAALKNCAVCRKPLEATVRAFLS